MNQHVANPERTIAFSDGVFAVIITILLLDLRPPESADWSGLWSLWPKGVSYGASYFFLAIVWLNHHYLMRYVHLATARLLWGNFAHLFSVSLVPFATAWISATHLGAIPVVVYATIFALVNLTYLILCREGIDRGDHEEITPRLRRVMRMRSAVTLGVFAAAAFVALKFPLVGMAMIITCLIVYVRPEAPGQDVPSSQRGSETLKS